LETFQEFRAHLEGIQCCALVKISQNAALLVKWILYSIKQNWISSIYYIYAFCYPCAIKSDKML